jgi:GNAT superfamily N-acetyltransferase
VVTPSTQVRLSPVSYEDPIAAALCDRLTAEMHERYRKAGGEEALRGPRLRPTPEQFDPPDGVFFIALTDGEAVGCGALRRWGPGMGEIKRMYVDPAVRGRGVGRAILEELEMAARQRAYRILRLETGTPQPEAIRLYEAAGYARIEPYRLQWSGELSVALEKHLIPEAATGQVTLLDARFDDPEAMELCWRLEHEEEERYGPRDHAERPGHRPVVPPEFVPPAGLFVVARLDGRSLGCGGVRPHEGTIAEIKRMYVDPPVRRQGIARRILARLEDAARHLGYRTIRVQTGNGQPEAIALYGSTGYERIPAYGEFVDDPFSVCFEKQLAEGSAPAPPVD